MTNKIKKEFTKRAGNGIYYTENKGAILCPAVSDFPADRCTQNICDVDYAQITPSLSSPNEIKL